MKNQIQLMPKTLFLLLILALFLLSGCMSLAEDITPPPGYQAPTAAQDTPTPAVPVYPMLPPNPARGAPLYAEKCAPCHGPGGLGNGPDADELPNPVTPLGDPAYAREAAPDDWYLMVTNGNMGKFMPPFTSLSVPERWDVIAYAYTLGMTPEELARGEELYQQYCINCHGERGAGDGPDAGTLTVSPVDFTNQEFMGARAAEDLFTSITDGLGEMHAYAELPEADRWAVAAYLRTLSFEQTDPAAMDDPEPTATVETAETEPGENTPAETEAAPAERGTVTVRVVNISGEAVPSDLSVDLYVYDHMTEVYSQTTALSPEGAVVIEDVPLIPEGFLIASIEHNGLSFGSNLAVIEPGLSAFDLEIRYADVTHDPSVLNTERLHVFLDFVSEGTVQVYLLNIFSNTSNLVLLGDPEDQPAVTFTLPAGAANVQRDVGMAFQDVDTPDGFGLMEVYPNAEPYQVLYSFDMPYEKNKVEFDLPIDLETQAVILMMPENGVRLKSEQLSDAGPRDIEGVSYSMYTGGNLPAGGSLDLAISGKPKAVTDPTAAPTGVDTMTGLVIGLGVFGVVLVATGIYLWFRSRRETDEIVDWYVDETQAGDTLETPEEIMDAIITLDDLYAAGEMPESAYLERRAELKARLAEQMDQDA